MRCSVGVPYEIQIGLGNLLNKDVSVQISVIFAFLLSILLAFHFHSITRPLFIALNFYVENIWINLPIMVDANFIEQLAVLVKSSLSQGINVWLENSNEVWNGAVCFTLYP